MFLLLAVCMLGISCQKEEPSGNEEPGVDNPSVPDKTPETVTVEVSLDDAAVKSFTDSEGLRWQAGDRLVCSGGIDLTSEALKAEDITGDGTKAVFTFDGSLTSEDRKVWFHSTTCNSATVEFPDRQTQSAAGEMNPEYIFLHSGTEAMDIHKGEELHIVMKIAGSIFRFIPYTAEYNDEKIVSVTLSSSSPLAGTVEYNRVEGTYKAVAEGSPASVTVSLGTALSLDGVTSMDSGKGVYMAVPATDAPVSGYKYEVETDVARYVFDAGDGQLAVAGNVVRNVPLNMDRDDVARQMLAPGIYDAAGYAAFAEAVNAGGDLSAWTDEVGEVNLYADLEQDGNYIYVNEFSGIFNGNGHRIVCNRKSRPLFNVIAEGAVVKNLTAAGTYTGLENQGEQAFASFARINKGTIENCINETSGELTSTVPVAFGGFVGQNGGLIKDCTNKGSILLTMSTTPGLVCYGGGFAAYGHLSDGSKSGKFENCVNQGTVEIMVTENASLVRTGFGGICGVVVADGVSFIGCTNEGTVARIDNGAANNTCASSVGGILGRSARHHNSAEFVDMDGNLGRYNTSFTGCSNSGTVINAVRNGHNFKSQSSDELGNKKCSAGGIVGALVGKTANPSVLSGCINSGEVYSGFNTNNNSHVTGGLVGMVRDANLVDCVSTGKVASYESNISGPAGGFIGFVLANVTVSGGEARPEVSVKKVASPSLWSYGLVIGCVRTNGNTSISDVKTGGSISVNGTPETITADNFEDFLCVNKHFTCNPTVTGCTWAE